MAEALWTDEIRERTLRERQVIAARMAQATDPEDWDTDNLPDVDKALELFTDYLNGDVGAEGMSANDERRLAVGLGRKR